MEQAKKIDIQIQLLDEQMPLPRYAHPGDAGADLASREDVILQPGERKLVPTGVAIALPVGYVGFIHPRSGLAARSGLSIVNTPGTIDAGYRGEIKICLINTDRHVPIELKRGDLIAQLVIQEVVTARFEQVTQLPQSSRGAGGYGSTGGVSQWQDQNPTSVMLEADSEGETK